MDIARRLSRLSLLVLVSVAAHSSPAPAQVPGVTGDTGNTQISGSPSRAKEVLVDGVASTGIESGGVIPGSARPSVKIWR